jgi:membrane-associated protease RseP (regulator of RpoE activity)
MTGVAIFVVAILIVVMIHESGHFLVAKAFGFKATKYFVGFGPTIWSTERGETEYGVKALPLGGFVKIVGMNPYEEVPPEDEPRAYFNKPRWQRALVIVAGSATHFLVAFLILLVTAMTIGFPTDEPSNEIASVTTEFDGEPTTAAALGLEPGDKIVGVGNVEDPTWDEISTYIRAHAGEEGTFEIKEEDGDVRTETVDIGTAIFSEDGEVVAYAPPGEEIEEPAEGQEVGGFVGISPARAVEKDGFIAAVGTAGYWTWETTERAFVGIGDMFGMVFGGELWDALGGEGERGIEEGPLGIVGAGRIASESVSSGEPYGLIALIVGFTIFVGLMNLLPLPPLDGGHLAVIGWESVTGKAVDVRKLIPIAAAVISFFVILFVAVLYLDLARPVKVPF